MFDKFFVGLDLTETENNGEQPPISRVTLLLDDENSLTAGDDTGAELVADCPHATQAMVNAILAQVKGHRYQMYSAGNANIDPSAELGDGVTVDGIYSVISRIDDDGSGYAGLSAPGEAELEDEYPSAGPMTQAFSRKISETRSRITKTAEQIRLEVSNELKGLSASIDVRLDSITQEVKGLGGAYSSLKLTVDSITQEVKDAQGNISTLQQTAKDINASIRDVENGLSQTVRIAADGVTVTNAAGSKLTIDGGQISAENLRLTGCITWNDLAADTQQDINGAYQAAGTAQNTANNALSAANGALNSAGSAINIANALANGTGGGTFINGTTIQSPSVIGGTITGTRIYFGEGGNIGGLFSGSGFDGVSQTQLVQLGSAYGLVLHAGTNMRIEANSLWVNIEASNIHVKKHGVWASLLDL